MFAIGMVLMLFVIAIVAITDEDNWFTTIVFLSAFPLMFISLVKLAWRWMP